MTAARVLRRVARSNLDEVRGAWWALRAVRRVRRDLRLGRLEDVHVLLPTGLRAAAGPGVDTVLRRLEPSCLERSLVLQRWLAAQGIEHEVVIGVTGGAAFSAHAWLDGESPRGYREIRRMAP